MPTTNDLLFKEIMERLFEIIGLKFKEDIVKKEGWYTEHTWAKEQEEEFTQWLTQLLAKKKRLGKTRAKSEAQFFVFAYGWKRSDEHESGS